MEFLRQPLLLPGDRQSLFPGVALSISGYVRVLGWRAISPEFLFCAFPDCCQLIALDPSIVEILPYLCHIIPGRPAALIFSVRYRSRVFLWDSRRWSAVAVLRFRQRHLALLIGSLPRSFLVFALLLRKLSR